MLPIKNVDLLPIVSRVPRSKVTMTEVEGQLLRLQPRIRLPHSPFQRITVVFTRDPANPQQNVFPEIALRQRHPSSVQGGQFFWDIQIIDAPASDSRLHAMHGGG